MSDLEHATGRGPGDVSPSPTPSDPRQPRPRRTRRRIAMAVALVVWVLAILVAIDFVLHRRFVAQVRRKDPPPWLAAVQGDLPPPLMRQLGTFQNTKRSSFLRVAERKLEGVTRVCAFGDSFTHGAEVGEASDYPSRLQTLLDERAPDRFEVLNFGSDSYGFHQTYLMWETLGARYGCDHVLLGPATFFPERDTSFNHVGLDNPYYLHGRYVLDGDDVRLIEVRGDTLEERFDAYLRFVPHLDYARFDRSPPSFLRAALRPGQTITNPFYYLDESMAAEAHETYRRLLRRMSAGTPSLLVASGATVRDMLGELDPARVRGFEPVLSRRFPYRAPQNHQGPMGNDLLARQYLAHLVPDAPAEATVLRTQSLPPQSGAAKIAQPAPPLSSYAAVHAEIAGVPVAHFVRGTQATRRRGSPTLLRKAGVAALLHVAGPRPERKDDAVSVVDGCFTALTAPLTAAGEVCLRVKPGAGHESRRCIGRALPLAPGIAVATLALDGVTIEDRPLLGEESKLVLTPKDPALAAFLKPAKSITLEIDGRPALQGTARGGWFLLSPGKGGCYRLRANLDGVSDVERIGASGLVELVLDSRDGPARRVPIAKWTTERRPLDGA